MSKPLLRDRAIEMRGRGFTINEISHALKISKSTASLWTRDVEVSEEVRDSIINKKISSGAIGRKLGVLANKKKKSDSIILANECAKKLFGKIDINGFFYAGLALYWGEGSKKIDYHLSFINSDPDMIVFMHSWFKEFFNITNNDFIFRVYINEKHKQRVGEVLDFWSELLSYDKHSFKKTVFSKVKTMKVYNNYSNYYGMLSIRIKRSTLIKYKILALIELMRKADVAQVARASHS